MKTISGIALSVLLLLGCSPEIIPGTQHVIPFYRTITLTDLNGHVCGLSEGDVFRIIGASSDLVLVVVEKSSGEDRCPRSREGFVLRYSIAALLIGEQEIAEASTQRREAYKAITGKDD